MSVLCKDCFCQFDNDKCLSNHLQRCDGAAVSGNYKTLKKFHNLLNNHYLSEGFSGQHHDMHEHGIEMTLAKRICMVQNILEHANTEICDVCEDCHIDNVT